EAVGLKPIECGFESRRGHESTRADFGREPVRRTGGVRGAEWPAGGGETQRPLRRRRHRFRGERGRRAGHRGRRRFPRSRSAVMAAIVAGAVALVLLVIDRARQLRSRVEMSSPLSLVAWGDQLRVPWCGATGSAAARRCPSPPDGAEPCDAPPDGTETCDVGPADG